MTPRAVSTVVNYVLALGIMSVMITGLIIAGGTYVQDQREQTARAEMEVIGQRISGDLSVAARMAAAGRTTTVAINRSFPDTVAGLSYQIDLSGGSDPQLTLSTESPAVTVTVPVALTRANGTVDVGSTTVTGGDVDVVYYPDSTEVTLES